jgi:Tfp pilus assembly major pilin PilA
MYTFSYCLTDDDKEKDAKMVQIQQSYITSQYSSNCSNLSTPLKKTIRLKKRHLSMTNMNESSCISDASGSIDDQSSMTSTAAYSVIETKDNKITWKKKDMKKHLEKVIVICLKMHHIKRSDACFHSCYVKLFKIGKMFMKDMKPTCDIGKQIEKIIKESVNQVVNFEREKQL